MRWILPAALGGLMTAGLAMAQTPAERAGQALEREIARDRLRDAAEAARAADTAPARGAPPSAPQARQLDEDRAAGLQPDVGRPERLGRLPGTQRTPGADGNVQR
ncbi:hypothetical protein [Crenalkalicoccus roseus]|uniref:hypothetical protein n=1 Tax=Crenalkalicoccus roseus TaxID=1485588 RepID=UPI00108106CD|nr:hypothetical protein [Crenalkalicoccus roseus]